jgi:hypothetical protein
MAISYLGETGALMSTAAGTLDVPSIPAGTDVMHICSISMYTGGGSPGTSEVTSVTGGGMTWARISGTIACSGRISQPRGEMWWAFGSPSSFTATVTFENDPSDDGAQAVVSRLSGCENTAPINGNHSNSNGTSSPSCGGGTDDTDSEILMTVSNADSMMLISGCPRNKTYSSTDADYTEEYFVENTD